jgi:hypothetical protein
MSPMQEVSMETRRKEMKVYHTIKCLYRKSIGPTADKIHIKGEPFELVRCYPDMASQSAGIDRVCNHVESLMPGHIPYLYSIKYANGYALYMHRCGAVNKQTRELVESI